MKHFAAIALLLLNAPAMAQDAPVESVTVNGNSLVGVWRVSRPIFVAMEGFFSPVKFGPLQENFCRITPQKDELAVFCTSPPEAATVTVKDGHVHLAWGTMMARLVIDGELESADHFRGHFQIKLSGLTFENPAFSEGRRVMPEARAPDKAGKAMLLRQILGNGLASVPRDAAAMKTWPDIPKLGAVIAVSYLGQETKWGGPAAGPPSRQIPDQPDFFSVYLVNFAQGERLCALHQREDGVLDWFRCA